MICNCTNDPNDPASRWAWCRNLALVVAKNDGVQWSDHELGRHSPVAALRARAGLMWLHLNVNDLAAQLAWFLPTLPEIPKPGGKLQLPGDLESAAIAADAMREAEALPAYGLDLQRRRVLFGNAINIRGQIQPDSKWMRGTYRPPKIDAALARTDPRERLHAREILVRQESLALRGMWDPNGRFARRMSRMEGTAAV